MAMQRRLWVSGLGTVVLATLVSYVNCAKHSSVAMMLHFVSNG
jgi:hypothetical protein